MNSLQWFLLAMSPTILLGFIILMCSEWIYVEENEHGDESDL